MKVLFLDFDGVLNSTQEVHWHWRARDKRYPKRFRGPATLIGKIIAKVLSLVFSEKLRGTRFAWILYHKHLWHLYYLSDHCYFCPIACSNIQLLLDENPDLHIVVSSVWRSWGVWWLKRIFKRNGIDPIRLIGVTPREGEDANGSPEMLGRGNQIQHWLNRHKHVTKFVIVDDDSDMVHLKRPDCFVQTNKHHGFMFLDYRAAHKILNGQNPDGRTLSEMNERD